MLWNIIYLGFSHLVRDSLTFLHSRPKTSGGKFSLIFLGQGVQLWTNQLSEGAGGLHITNMVLALETMR